MSDLSETGIGNAANENGDGAMIAEQQSGDIGQPKRKLNWKKRLMISIAAVLVVAMLAAGAVVIIQAVTYSNAIEALNSGDYDAAIRGFTRLGRYRDSQEQLMEANYGKAVALAADGQYLEAIELFELLGDYEDSITQAKDARRGHVYFLLESGQLGEARSYMEAHQLADYKGTGREVQYYEVLITFGMTKENDSIVFESSVIEGLIRIQIGKETGTITLRDMLDVTAIEFDPINNPAAVGKITDLNDLRYCLNLEKLHVTNQPIKNLEGLRGLVGLRSLQIHGCGVKDLSPLSGAVNLENAWLNGNPVGNAGLAVLCKLPNIKSINASWGTNISSLEALNDCTTLEEFLCERKFSDITPFLNNPHIKTLSIVLANKGQLDVLKQLKEINWLCLNDSGLTSEDLSFLSGYNLVSFIARNNRITDLDFLSGSTKLWQLQVPGNRVTDITQLLNKTDLEWVSLPSSVSAADRQRLHEAFPNCSFTYY